MPILIGNTNIQQLLNDSRIGMGNQFNPVEAIYSGGTGITSNIWNRSILGVITPITISDKLGLGTSTFIGSERLRVLGETNTDTLRTQTGYLDSLRLRNSTSYLALNAPVTTGRTVTFQDKDGIVALLSDTQSLPNYALVSTYTQTNSAISGAITNSHIHTNKSLLDTYTQTNSDLASAVSLKHSHSNKSLLDTYNNSNSDITNAISNTHIHLNKDLLDGYTQTNSDLAVAVSNSHTHSNKALLDTYTQTDSDISNAVLLAHSHSNKSILDTYNQSNSDLSDAVTRKHAHINLSLLETYTQTNANIILAVTNQHSHSNKTILDGIINSGSGDMYLSDAGDYRGIIVAPVGLDTQVVFNDGGVTLAGDSGLVYNKTTNQLTVGVLQTSSILNIENSSTYLSKNVGGDLVFTDVNSGSVTLAALLAGNTNYWNPTTGGILYTNYVGINNPISLDEALTVSGNIQADYFNSSFLRYKNSNLLLGPNAGDNDTGSNKLYLANTNTSTPLIYGEFDNQLLKFYADVYIYGTKILNFGSAITRIYWSTGNNLTFQDAVANSGNAIKLTELIDGTYNAKKSDFTDYTAVTSITSGNKSTWNKSSVLITTGDGSKYLGDDGLYHTSSSGGVTPTDNILKWDSSSSYYRAFSSKTEAGGVSSGGKFYGGTTDPTNSNRLNYDGEFHALGIYSANAGTFGGYFSGTTTGVTAYSNSGYGLYSTSQSGIPGYFSTISGSSIGKFIYNSVTVADITSTGINLATGADYKINGNSIVHNAVTIGTANGLSLSTQQLSLATATSSTPGAISRSGDLISSDITITGGTNAVIGTGTSLSIIKGNLTEGTSSVLTITGGSNALLGSGATITVTKAGAIDSGYLSNIDWVEFYNKKPSQSTNLTFNPANPIVFDKDYQFNPYTVTSDIVITTNMIGAIALNRTELTLVGDGIHTITIAGAAKDFMSGDFDNTFGTYNRITFTYDGIGVYYIIPQIVDLQPLLVSGTNIKTINGNSILGSGDLTISTGVTPIDGIFHWDGTAYNPYTAQSTNKFDNSVTNPSNLSNRLNYNGTFYASELNATYTISGYSGVFDNSGGGNTLLAYRGSNTNTSQPIFYIEKYTSGTPYDTGNFIEILDNPTTSGTTAGSILKATIGSTVRIDMNPRVLSGGNAYTFDTLNSLSSGKLFTILNSGNEKVSIDFSGNITAASFRGNVSTVLDSHYLSLGSSGRCTLLPETSDGASVVAYTLGTVNTLSTSGAKLLSIQNNTVEKAAITKDGNIYQAGTFAGIYVTDGTTTQSIPTGATYTKLTAFTTNGQSSNCTSDATNDKITITKTGRYFISWSTSLSSGTANVVVYITPFLNAVEQMSSHAARKIATAGDIGAISGCGFINVTSANWDLDLRVRHDNGGSVNLTPLYCNLTVQYVGE